MLCSQCSSIFLRKHSLADSYLQEETITLSRTHTKTDCSLCALMKARFFGTDKRRLRTEPAQDVTLKYWLLDGKEELRQGTHCFHFECDDVESGYQEFNIVPVPYEEVNQDSPRRMSNDTSSKQSNDCSIDWMRNCQRNHSSCRNLTPRNHSMPTRLLDVGLSGMTRHVRLCHSSGIPPGTPYVTLSHSWGSKRFFCLRKENQILLEQKVPLSKLRRVFQHAIQLTRRIGIRYIWIDSLCIIQNSKADWTHEAAMMSTVYANGACNLAATGFVNGAEGLFALRRPSLLQPILVDINDAIYFEGELAFQKGQYFLVEADSWKEEIEEGPLNQRGWVMQERMLSPRSLHFGSRQIFWECCEMEACEVFPAGLPKQMLRRNAKKLLSGLSSAVVWDRSSSRRPLTRRAAKLCKVQRARTRWYEIVDAYTKKCLTQGSDKLIAVAGVAAVMRPIFKCRYLAGMWEDKLIDQLIWSVHSSQVRPRPRAYRCPSWSWASVDSRVDTVHWDTDVKRSTPLAKILQADVIPAGPHDLSTIKDGHLIISGRLGVVRLYRSDEFVPRDYKLTQIDLWFDDDISLDAIDTQIPSLGKKPIKAFQIIETGTDRYEQLATSDAELMCFFMPIAFHKNLDHLPARTVGLLLLPTGQSRGDFRRIGMFAAYLKHSIAQLHDSVGTIAPSYYRSKIDEGIYTICIT